MKYKEGDIVKVHTKEWFEQNCFKNCLRAFEHQDGDNTLVEDMIKFCGKEVIINQVDLYNYNILEDGGEWYWQDWMFEDMNNNINIISNPNIVEDFAKLIGVELDEEFYSNKGSCRYKFTADSGLMIYDGAIEDWRVAAFSLTIVFKMIKEGKFIKKWTPKNGDRIYFPVVVSDTLHDYTIYHKGNAFDEEMLEKGLYFRTQEEAIECAKQMIENRRN